MAVHGNQCDSWRLLAIIIQEEEEEEKEAPSKYFSTISLISFAH